MPVRCRPSTTPCWRRRGCRDPAQPGDGPVLTRARTRLVADGERWPVLDGIAFLRADRRALADAALACLDTGDRDGALVLLLGDQDGWARTPPPTEAARRDLLARRHALSFREAMALLAFGPVGTYFAHRWSDPTFLSGLALAQSYWGAPRTVLELACGAGHFLRAFAGHAAEVVGGDLVFAKLWLARHWVAPQATLVCFDAAAPWPFAERRGRPAVLPRRLLLPAEQAGRRGRDAARRHAHPDRPHA